MLFSHEIQSTRRGLDCIGKAKLTHRGAYEKPLDVPEAAAGYVGLDSGAIWITHPAFGSQQYIHYN